MDKNEWRTPPELYQKYNVLYGFSWDMAATADNSLCVFWHNKNIDSLKSRWPNNTNCWCNPPYGPRNEINKWVDKAILEAIEAVHRGNWLRVVMLLPSRTDTKWFQRLWNLYTGRTLGDCGGCKDSFKVDIEFLQGRVKFVREDGIVGYKPKEGSVVVTIFGDGRMRSPL